MTPLTAREALADVRLLTVACRLARGESLASVAAGFGITANNLQKYAQARGWEVRYRAPRWGVFYRDKQLTEDAIWPVDLRVAFLDWRHDRVRTACRLARVARQHGYEWRRVPAQRGLYRGEALLIDSLPPGWTLYRGKRQCNCTDAFDESRWGVLYHDDRLWCAACAAGALAHEENWK